MTEASSDQHRNVVPLGCERSLSSRREDEALPNATAFFETEEALRLANAKYQSLVETTSDFIWELDASWRFTYCSPQAKELWGYEPGDLLGKTPFDQMPEEERHRGYETLMDLVVRWKTSAGRREPFLFRSVSYDIAGCPMYVETKGVPFFDGEGRLVGVRGVTRDISERQQAEEDLRRTEQRFELLSEANSLLLTSENPEEVIQVIGERVMRHLEADVFFNYVLDEGAESLRLNAYGGVDASIAEAISRLERGQAICGCVARDGVRIVSEDVQHNRDSRADLVRGMGVRAYACHPLCVHGSVIGTLSFGTKRKDAFGEDELALMRTVTDQVSVAMQKSRLLQEQQTRRRRSEAFHRLLDAGVSSLDVHQSAQRVLASLSAQPDFDLSSVWLLEGDCLELVAQVGYPPEYNRPVPLTAPFDAIDVFKTGCPKIEPRPSNPAVLEFYEKMGIELRAFAIFPLTARDKSVGVLALVWSRDVNLGGQDVVFYQSVADEIAVVLENARLYQSEHHVAETLQETLVVLPAHVPGVAYSRAYRSATLECGRVGGDFVDVFEAGKHLVGISLGDVSGKGLEAAVMTSSIRTTLRVHAIDRKPPATVVTKANEVLRRLTRVEEFVTLWFGLLNTRTGQLRYVCAGHPPALVLSADGSLRELACKDPIVGAFDDVRFRERETVLTRGDRLVLYSDGATEARSESGKFLGEEGLRAHVRDLGSASTIELASALMGDIVAYSAGVLRDDVALLAVEPTKVRTLAHAGQLKAFDADAG